MMKLREMISDESRMMNVAELKTSEMMGREMGLDVLGQLECEQTHPNQSHLLAELTQDSLLSMLAHSHQYRTDFDALKFIHSIL